jgi:general secretion pathway protein G
MPFRSIYISLVNSLRSHPSRLKNERGMTLIEIMIVIAIIAGLMAVLGSTANNTLQKSRVENAKIQIKEISKQLDAYNLDCNSYPTTENGLRALVQSPGPDVCANWGPNPYLKKEPKDPWGKAFIYESDGSTFMLKSLGRDGKEGGEGFEKDLNSQELE